MRMPQSETESAELVRILREQVSRQDERITTLESILERANQELSLLRANSGASRQVQRANAAPIKLPDLGPQIQVIAQAVASAASAKTGGEVSEQPQLIDTGRLKRSSARKPGLFARLGLGKAK